MFNEDPKDLPGAIGGQVGGEFGAHDCRER
jgi:hypothetical protein